MTREGDSVSWHQWVLIGGVQRWVRLIGKVTAENVGVAPWRKTHVTAIVSKIEVKGEEYDITPVTAKLRGTKTLEVVKLG